MPIISLFFIQSIFFLNQDFISPYKDEAKGIDSTFYIPYIRWDFNSDRLSPHVLNYLDSFLNKLNHEKAWKVHFKVYCCQIPEASAIYLYRRVKSLQAYFINKRIDKTRITVEGILTEQISDYDSNVIGLSKEEIKRKHQICIPIVIANIHY